MSSYLSGLSRSSQTWHVPRPPTSQVRECSCLYLCLRVTWEPLCAWTSETVLDGGP